MGTDYTYESIMESADRMLKTMQRIPSSPKGPSLEDNQTLSRYNSCSRFYHGNPDLFTEEQRRALDDKLHKVSAGHLSLLFVV